MKAGAYVVVPLSQGLDTVPAHHNVQGLSRTLMLSSLLDARAMVHIAIHRVTRAVGEAVSAGHQYADLDVHPFEEINLIWSETGELTYRYELDGKVLRVTSPATVVIPAGVSHKAEAVSGEGLFICMLLK